MTTRWTAEEDALLVAFAESGTPWTEVARQMGRTRPSIVGRAAALGLRGQRPPRWTARDLHDWNGAGGEDAARAYVGSHPGCVVYAWRVGNRHGLFAIEDATRIHDAPRSKGRGVA
ncbi:MAG TPA: SANT/Myb-like DNA-binding domain-containing protein [Thermomicrobiales bacterium]|nr:SANT/Myb-like DNA-binding domain-containing protein [Thermomicrobiales bacterium]